MVRILAFIGAVLLMAACQAADRDQEVEPSHQTAVTSVPASPGGARAATPSADSTRKAQRPTGAKGERSDRATPSDTKRPPSSQPTRDGPGRLSAMDRCGLESADLSLVQRDWNRVLGSVGRSDHVQYTTDFVAQLARFRHQDANCSADKQLSGFLRDARRVNRVADQSRVDYSVYARAAASGNSWLDALGIKADRLAAG